MIRAEINEIQTKKEKFNETKSQFFEKINKINKPLGKERWPNQKCKRRCNKHHRNSKGS